MRAASKAEAILSVLTAYCFKVSDGVRQRVLEFTDQSTLERWLARAIIATADAEVTTARTSSPATVVGAP